MPLPKHLFEFITCGLIALFLAIIRFGAGEIWPCQDPEPNHPLEPHVHQGGQAIIGNVQNGAGVQPKTEEQPDAKTITHAPEPEMNRRGERREISLAMELTVSCSAART